MKFKIIALMVIFSNSIAFSQSKDTTIEYKGALKMLNKEFIKHIPQQMYYKKSDSSYIDYNRYFDVIMIIKRDGTIGDEIGVFSIMDTVNAAYIVSIIKQTNGKWINHSGKDQMVLLPIYFLYQDSNDIERKDKILNMRQNYYLNNNENKIIYLDPIVTTAYSPVSLY